MSEFKSLDAWKVGWWKKGKSYRYCFGVMWSGAFPMIKYQTKRGALGSSRNMMAVNPAFDKWFPKAEYLGMDLPQDFEDKKKTDPPASKISQ